MLQAELTLEAVARCIAWVAIIALVAGFFWAIGAGLWHRACSWRAGPPT